MKKPRKSKNSLSQFDMGAAHLLDQILERERKIEHHFVLPFRAPAKVLTSLQQCIHCGEDIALLIFGDNASNSDGLEAYARLMAKPVLATNLPTYVITPPADPSSLENPSLLLKIFPVQEKSFWITPDEWLSLIAQMSDAHCK
ncbi:MAG: hypothetical protein Q7T74_07115 [Candidatus Saccharibacteria bacterium]|nr:hypothetical protein [Candidatus Saccharibacteria bacterium]